MTDYDLENTESVENESREEGEIIHGDEMVKDNEGNIQIRENELKKKKMNGFLQFCIYVVAVFIGAFLIVRFVAQRTTVDGMSMYSTLNDGDSLIVEKLSYRFGDVKRFDIVVFPHYDEARGEEVYYIKRVIGMPGENIQITDGKIYIDGEVLEEDYGYYIDNIPMQGYDAKNEIHIGDDEYFVLGDNRDNSIDSRKIGCIKRDDIGGRAVFRLFPLSEFGVIK